MASRRGCAHRLVGSCTGTTSGNLSVLVNCLKAKIKGGSILNVEYHGKPHDFKKSLIGASIVNTALALCFQIV